MYASAFVLGFHGCDESVGERVLAGKDQLRPSENAYDWLGHGIYFWENSPGRAIEWAKFVRDNPSLFKTKIQTPFVVGAVVEFRACLDLTEAESLEIVRAGYEDMKGVFDAVGSDVLEMPRNEAGGRGDEDLVKRKLDCAVINWVHAMRAERGLSAFDCVRGAFQEGSALYEGAGIRAKTHIQLCVRSRASIRGYFRPIVSLPGDWAKAD